MPRARVVAAGLLAAAAVLASACGSSAPTASPERLLQQAKTVLDATNAVHFTITSQAVSKSGTNVVGGDGDLARPNQLAGTFQVQLAGFTVSVKVIDVGNKFYAEPPFQTTYTATNPNNYGLGNPADLLSTSVGVSDMLATAEDPTSAGTVRLSGELLDQVHAQVAGKNVPVLPDLAPSVPVSMLVGIDPTTHQLRQVALTGPFTSTSSSTTYTVTLTNYGESFTATLPTS
ncbi:MAG: LppX_LprAFG lipoprotein [Acidimicrobiales bacterium]